MGAAVLYGVQCHRPVEKVMYQIVVMNARCHVFFRRVFTTLSGAEAAATAFRRHRYLVCVYEV